MRFMFTVASCLAMSLALASFANGQGPVRRAVRGAGEVVAGGTRGAARVAAGAGEAVADGARGAARVAEGAGEAAVGITRGAAQIAVGGVRAGVDVITPDVPREARIGGVVDRNAGWRFQQRNGDWWYYTPNNAWMYYRGNQWTPFVAESFTPNSQFTGAYDTGFRGINQPVDSQQMVFIDSGGRAVVCQGGRVSFLDGTALQSVARTQVNEQGFLMEQGQVQGQAGAPGQAQINQERSGLQSDNQAGVQAGIQQQSPQGVQAQGSLNQGPPQGQGQTPVESQSQNGSQSSTPPGLPTPPAAGANVNSGSR